MWLITGCLFPLILHPPVALVAKSKVILSNHTDLISYMYLKGKGSIQVFKNSQHPVWSSTFGKYLSFWSRCWKQLRAFGESEWEQKITKTNLDVRKGMQLAVCVPAKNVFKAYFYKQKWLISYLYNEPWVRVRAMTIFIT